MTVKLARLAACSVLILASGAAIAADMEKKGTTPYVTHFIFRPVQNLDTSRLGPRDVDASQPEMSCGTHIITGGTGKYKGITGSEPFACNGMPALAGEGGYTGMDLPPNTTWADQETP